MLFQLKDLLEQGFFDSASGHGDIVMVNMAGSDLWFTENEVNNAIISIATSRTQEEPTLDDLKQELLAMAQA